MRAPLLTIVLLSFAGSALAREFPEEMALPLYKAVARQCSAKDPVNAKHYQAGLALMIKRRPELAKLKVNEKDFPNFAQKLKQEVAAMDDKTLLGECMTLYGLAGEAMRAPPQEPPPRIGSAAATQP